MQLISAKIRAPRASPPLFPLRVSFLHAAYFPGGFRHYPSWVELVKPATATDIGYRNPLSAFLAMRATPLTKKPNCRVNSGRCIGQQSRPFCPMVADVLGPRLLDLLPDILEVLTPRVGNAEIFGYLPSMTDRTVKGGVGSGAVDDGSSAFYARIGYRIAMVRSSGSCLGSKGSLRNN